MTKLRMTIELEYDADSMHGDDNDSKEWFFGDLLGAEGTLALTSMELGGDIVGTVQVISAVEVADGHEHTQNQG